MKIDHILGPDQNAGRLAKAAYPTKEIEELWQSSRSDPTAVVRFIADHKGKGPIIEAIPGNKLEMQVTYFILGDRDTTNAELIGGPDHDGLQMNRLGQTDFFFVSQVLPVDARFVYSFNLYKTHYAGPKGEVEIPEMVHSDDAILARPDAPSQPDIVAKTAVPKGKTVQTAIKSSFLNEDRKITVYLPFATTARLRPTC